jgi:hypothetical protein
MKVINENREITHSGVYIIEKETSISFNFTEDSDAAKVTLEFIFDEQKNNGKGHPAQLLILTIKE